MLELSVILIVSILMSICPVQALNQCRVLKHIFTNINITGTSIRTPTTVASAAPDERPNSIVAVAMATSKWFDAPIMADGAASA